MFVSSTYAWLVLNDSEEEQLHILEIDLKAAQLLSQDQVNKCVASCSIFILFCGRRMKNQRSDCNYLLVIIWEIKY